MGFPVKKWFLPLYCIIMLKQCEAAPKAFFVFYPNATIKCEFDLPKPRPAVSQERQSFI